MVHFYLPFLLYGTILSPFVRQFTLLFYMYFFFFSQCWYNFFLYYFSLISHTVVAIITLSTTSHSSRLPCTPICHRYFIRYFIRGFTLLFYMYFFFFSQCCYNFFLVLFFVDFPYCGCNHYSFHHISFLSSTMYTYLSPLLYSRMSPKIDSYTSLLHETTCFFVFYFLLCLNSHLSLYSFFCDTMAIS